MISLAKQYLLWFSYLHEMKLNAMLRDTFENIYQAEGYNDAVCRAKADMQVERMSTKIQQFHSEVLDLTEDGDVDD